MLGGGWVKVKGKRVRDKNLSPLPHWRCLGILVRWGKRKGES
ncbi:hypothetical protein FDUTEX481_00489 [Tolypothrix sp. PCC 7601]|nr:hypothetical protein FDUTEX481_00489 [Tolypothrix sp. PCC 7601]